MALPRVARMFVLMGLSGVFWLLFCSKVIAQAPDAAAAATAGTRQNTTWPAGLQGRFLDGTEKHISISPCILFYKDPGADSTGSVPQCTVNPVYMLGRIYTDHLRPANESSAVNLSFSPSDANRDNNMTVPMTISRIGLFRLAQKQQHCSSHPDKNSCEADTKTPCQYINNAASAYALGLSGAKTACAYFTQATFARLLHWEMFQVEQVTANKSLLPGAVDCIWPPHKRQAVRCKASEVEKYCKMIDPQCAALTDTFRYSCQSEVFVEEYQNLSAYRGDPFNATQYYYQAALQRLEMATDTQAVFDSWWGQSYTSWFIYQFGGIYHNMEYELATTKHLHLATTSRCSMHKDKASCLQSDKLSSGGDHLCSWSREIPLPGMSDAANIDFPPKKCQLSAYARLQLAIVMDAEPWWNNTDTTLNWYEMEDILAQAYRQISNDTNMCQGGQLCNLRPSQQLWFPAWKPQGPLNMPDNCAEAI